MNTRGQSKDKKNLKKNIVVYDTETTGLNPLSDKIVEFSFSKLLNNTGNTILINPETDITKKITEINGITNDMIKKCKKFKEIISDLEKDIECKNKDDKTYLVAHNNIGFDELFLREEYNRINRKVPDNYVFIDTLPISRALLGNNVKNHQLQTLKKYFNIEVDDSIAHTAKADVVVLAELWEKLKELANEDRMIELSIASKKKMPFGKYKNELISEIPSDYIKWMKSQNIFSTKSYLHNIFIEYNEFYRINN